MWATFKAELDDKEIFFCLVISIKIHLNTIQEYLGTGTRVNHMISSSIQR